MSWRPGVTYVGTQSSIDFVVESPAAANLFFRSKPDQHCRDRGDLGSQKLLLLAPTRQVCTWIRTKINGVRVQAAPLLSQRFFSNWPRRRAFGINNLGGNLKPEGTR
jgi:hypothetical protein